MSRSIVIGMSEEGRVALDSSLPRHPNFPVAGVTFVDVLPLFTSPSLRSNVLDALAAAVRSLPVRIDVVAGFEARGFLLMGVAERLGLPFVCLRKKGKLPGARVSIDYALEYGTATLEMSEGAVTAGASVLLVDDVLATGGTAKAGAALLARVGARAAALAVVLEVTACCGAAAVDMPHVLTILRV